MLVQVVSLGTHVVDSQLAGPMLLMEVMPTILARRHFPPPTTEESIKPGYRDSPDPAQDMALVFTRVPFRPRLPSLSLQTGFLFLWSVTLRAGSVKRRWLARRRSLRRSRRVAR